jgi:7-carboxy-7-deazaguanine synthase
MINVNEIFATLQGEGVFAGVPATFIRLQGCPVGCPWCDTKHTWPTASRKEVDIDVMLHKTGDAPTWSPMTAEQIEDVALELGQRHFVITGGEPAAQDIYDLTVLLGRHGRVQIETSGTYPVNVSIDTWVTVSPKIDMPGGLDVLPGVMIRADEIKLPVADQEDIEKFLEVIEPLGDLIERDKISLQPVSLDSAATKLCIEACRAHNWRLSIQTHKLISVR